MNTYFALFLIATFSALIITPMIRRLCQRFKLLDVPADARRVHKKAIPRLGGVAIFASFILALSALPLVSNALTHALRSQTSEIFTILIPATLVLLLGVYDDLRGTNAVVKFLSLGLIAALFYALGGRIEVLAVPFAGNVQFHPVLGFLITVFWLVGISNAFNLIDGMDGLATGAALFSSLVILIVALAGGNPLMVVMALVLCGALTGFLRYNFNPASIFLGDSGALFAGFLLASLSVLGAQKATTAVAVITPILAFGLPVMDTGMTMVRRLISGRPLFQGDGEHIHHMLLARGWSQRRVVLILYAACAVFGLVAALSTNTSSPVIGLLLFVIAVAVIIAVGHLRYHEVDELRAGMKLTVSDRRLRVANNIRVRRASLALTKAHTLNEMFEAVGQMLGFEEFTYANAQIGQVSHAAANERAFTQAKRKGALERVEFVNGRIAWSWAGEGIDIEDVIGSSEFWCFRLPLATANGEWGWMNLYRPLVGPPLLVDLNYLASFLQIELSAATERILGVLPVHSSLEKLSVPVSAKKALG